MDVGLPRETQQIDRFMEAFAAQYRRCHPNLFASDGEYSVYHTEIQSLTHILYQTILTFWPSV